MKQKTKILLYDLELTPSLGYVWGKYDQNVLAFEREWELLSFSYKWLGDRKTIAIGQDQFSEEILVRRLWELFDEADIIIGHNSGRFDDRKSNAKFIEYGLLPPSPHIVIDTLRVARKYFAFTSNKLGDLGKTLGVGSKLDTGGFETWVGCMRGDKKAWKKMLLYNKQDVILLEKIYLKLRPWIDNHPAVNVIDQIHNGCPKCGCTHLQRRGTRKAAKTGTYTRYQCQGCGGWSTSRSAQKVEVQFVN